MYLLYVYTIYKYNLGYTMKKGLHNANFEKITNASKFEQINSLILFKLINISIIKCNSF